MSWLPDELFIVGNGTPSPARPIGQGDVFLDVPVAVQTKLQGDGAQAKAKKEIAIVVASSCGMRKATSGALSDLIHVAPVKALASLAPGWESPYDESQHLRILPLPGLAVPGIDGTAAANLERIGLASARWITIDNRIGSLTVEGMATLKARIATYFVRQPIPAVALQVGAHEEWHELALWQRWTETTGDPDGFQDWLSEMNPNYRGSRRRDTLYDDLVGVTDQLGTRLAG